MRFQGKRAFVTAAGQGIGRAIAERFSAEGAHVVATDLKSDLLAGLGTAEAFALDVTDKEALQAAVESAKADILVNCAGFVHAGTITEATDADFDVAMNLNVRSQFHAMQAALPGMAERGNGSIVNISSVASSIIAAPNRFIYGMSKAAEAGLARNLSLEWGPQGIRVNSIAPGLIRTDFAQALLEDPDRLRKVEEKLPLRRVGEPVDIAGVALFLASSASAYVTGQTIVADGGDTIA